jgi:cell division protein FtsA
MKKIITAIDIGTTKIVAIAGERNASGKIQIISMGSVPTPKDSVSKGVVQNIEQVSKAIIEAVDIACEKGNITFEEAYIGIAGQHIHTRRSSHSVIINSPEFEILKSDVEKLQSEIYHSDLDPGEEILHVIPQDYTVDKNFGITKPAGMYGRKLHGNFNIIIGESISAKNIKRCVERVGITPVGIYLEPLASSAAVLTEDEKEAGVALIDIGGGTTDLAIYYEGILRYTAIIPFGGDIITSDIKKGCIILPKVAEAIKVKHGKALSEFAPENSLIVVEGINGRESKQISMRTIAEIIQARVEEICEIIDFELTGSGYRNKLAAGISLTGGGALLKHIQQLMKYKLGLDVKLSRPGDNLSSANRDINNPKYSTAVGLLMLGIEDWETKYAKMTPEEYQQYSEKPLKDEDIDVDEKNPKKRKRNIFGNFKQTLIEFMDDNDKEV